MTADHRLLTANDLPLGWVWTQLGEVCLKPQYGWTTSAASEGTLRLLRTTDITSGYVEWETVPFCKEEPPEKEKFLLKDGDIVVSRAGSVGYSHLVRNPPEEVVFASYLIRFKPLIDRHYVAFFLKSPLYWEAISEKSSGIAIPNVNATKLRQVQLPLAPLSEQRRIVAKIEALFAQSRRGQEALDAVPDLLAQFRQAVLAAAFRGDLTERDPDDEPASVLMERIRAERRRLWEEDLRAQGKDSSRHKYEEPAPPDTADLPELPEGWEWEVLEVCSDVITKGESPGWQGYEYVEEGVLFIRSESVLWGRLDYSSPVYIPEKFHKKLSRSQLQPSDVLINLVGASIGRAAVVPQDVGQANVNQAVALIRLNGSLLPPYLMYLLISPSIQRVIQGKKVDVARANISLTDLRELRVPVPPLAEQRRIVVRIEALFAQADVLEAQVAAVRRRLEQVDQTVLARAFRGELVPQDPDDEPASVLLERIRKEREAGATSEKKRKTQQMRLPTV